MTDKSKTIVVGMILGAAFGVVLTKVVKGEVCLKCVAIWTLVGAGIGYYKANK